VRFAFDKASGIGRDEDGAYSVTVKGERYGTLFEIALAGDPLLEIWARRLERPPHEGEQPKAPSLIEWIIDNRAGTGAPLLTLGQRLGDRSLGEIMGAFLLSYEAAFTPQWDPALTPLALGCRGNQRSMMESRFGP